MTSWHVSPEQSEPHTQLAVKIFLSPSPIKFWSQIPRIKNIPDRGSTVGPNQDPRALIVNFIYGAPCLHKMDRKEDRLTLSNHFIKDDTLLAAWKRTLSPDCIKSREGINKTSEKWFPAKISSLTDNLSGSCLLPSDFLLSCGLGWRLSISQMNEALEIRGEWIVLRHALRPGVLRGWCY